MNKVILMGRLTRDPNITYPKRDGQTTIAKYTLAVNRRMRQSGDEQNADFINCVAFGRGAEFADKYLRQGTKISVVGRIQTGSYTNNEGRRIYTTDVIVEEQEFAESKKNTSANVQNTSKPFGQESNSDGFMSVPEGMQDEMPFLP